MKLGFPSTRAFTRKATPKLLTLRINTVNAYHSRLKQWLNRFNSIAAETWQLGGAAAWKPRASTSIRQNRSSARWEINHPNQIIASSLTIY